MKPETCPLCQGEREVFRQYKKKTYYQCQTCRGIFLGPEFLLDQKKEKARYDFHENDVYSLDFQAYGMPMVETILAHQDPSSLGLDFGCGPGPVMTKLLQDRGYHVKLYDPYYAPFPENLDLSYDFIIVSEVAEHFYHPRKEFARLKALLRPGGSLFVKTQRTDAITNFDHWYYKNDPTHVFFYAEKTFTWIRDHFGFSGLEVYEDYVRLWV